MKRHGLIFTTLGSVIIAGILFFRPGWSNAGSPTASDHEILQHTKTQSADLFQSADGSRWRSGQPAHWRAFLLQR